MKYKRVILKISGEALQASNDIIDYDVLSNIKDQLLKLQQEGVEVAIVVGGGNIYRGFGAEHIEEEKAHYMGMLASSINALALSSYLNKNGVKATFQNSFDIERVADKVDAELATNELAAGYVVIFGGGTGEPFVSTDTGAAWRANDIKADAILMAKNGVDGVFTDDPRTNPEAKLIKELTFTEIINNDLKVMDKEAAEYLNEKDIEVVVFNMDKIDNIIKIIDDDTENKTVIRKG